MVREDLPEGVRVDISEEIILNEDVLVVSDDPTLEGVELLEDGFYQFTFSNAPELFATGTILVGDEGPGYMGRVAEVRASSPTVVDVRLDPVGLDEVIDEGSFFTRIVPNAEDFVATTDDVGGRRSGLGGTYDLVPTEILDGAGTCEGLAEGSISFRHEFKTTDVTTEFIFEKRGLFGIQRAGVTATGGAAVRLTLDTEGQVNADCLLDVLELLRVNPIEWSRSFRIGPLPVRVYIRLRPELTTSVIVDMEPTRVETTLYATASLRLGAIYDRDSGITPIAEFDRTVDVDMDLEEGGSVTARAGVHAGLYLGIEVSGLRLPSAGAEFDAEASITTDDLACTWNWDATVSGQAYLRGPLGVDLGFFSRTFTTLDSSIGFEQVAGGAADQSLPYCTEDMCDEMNPCIGEDEECVEGVCVEMHCTPETEATDCAAGEVCVLGSCVPDSSGITDCDSCNRAGFDWCGATDSCGAEGCSGDLRTSRSSCIPCDYTNCGDCATDGFCSWVRNTSECVNDRAYDGDRTWLATTPGQCG